MSSLSIDGDDILDDLPINHSTSTLSMEENSPHQYGAPPEYEALVFSPRLLQKFNVQPREDEGHEILPPYSCSLSLENVFMRKVELEGAIHRAHDRNWYRVYATLQGTALTFHKYKGRGVFGKLDGGKSEECPDLPPGKRGSFLRSYNLQHAEVGIAADYHKKRYVIRVRAETDQFLLSCVRLDTFIQWLQSLFIAIDIAPPLDDRSIPRDLSIPRPRRRRRCVRFIGDSRNPDIESNTALVREQYEIIRRHYPGLINGMELVAQGAEIDTALQDTIAGLQEVGLLSIPSSRNLPHRSTSMPTIHPIPSSSANDLARAATSPNFDPSIDSETGKWRPKHNWTATYDMIYAKRCMAILTSNSPRKSKYIIIKGKEYLVDWNTGNLTRTGLPEYGEIDREEFDGVSGSGLKVGQYGTLIRV